MNRIKGLDLPWPKIVLVLSLLIAVIGALFSTKALSTINKNIAAAKEAARPANVDITEITVPGCKDCFNVDAAVVNFKTLNVKVGTIKTLALDTPEASAAVKFFGIKKVPTYIVTGETTKNNLVNFVKSNGNMKSNTFVFTNLTPVFVDPLTGKKFGEVTAIIISDPSCTQCKDLKAVVEGYEKSGVKVEKINEYAWDSADGQNIINQYKITKVPAFIFSPEFDLYGDTIKNGWTNFGTVEKDEQSSSALQSKTYVARNLSLPYRDLTSGQIVGLVSIVYLTDSSCPDCYGVQSIQKQILTNNYGVALQSEQTVDISSPEGKSLISQYKITKVPTVLLSPEADKYSNLKNVWQSVGTIAPDGWYVFTGLSQLGNITYKDLTSNQIIRPLAPSPVQAQ